MPHGHEATPNPLLHPNIPPIALHHPPLGGGCPGKGAPIWGGAVLVRGVLVSWGSLEGGGPSRLGVPGRGVPDTGVFVLGVLDVGWLNLGWRVLAVEGGGFTMGVPSGAEGLGWVRVSAIGVPAREVLWVGIPWVRGSQGAGIPWVG